MEDFKKESKENIDALEKWVWQILSTDLPERYTYHCINHIEDVLRDSQIIAKYYKVSERDRELLKVAALFHDIGFIKSHHNHEESGAKIAAKELVKYSFSEEEIGLIQNMIMATKIPQNPKTFLEEILCDADLYYLGEVVYPEISERLKLEWENIGIFENDAKWLDVQISFLEAHSFHTNYAIEKLAPIKQQTLQRLKQML